MQVDVVLCELRARAASAAAGSSPGRPEAPELRPPGVTTSRLEPADLIESVIVACEPCPIATIRMTEAMPTTMPSTVRNVRTLLEVMESSVSWTRS